MKIQFDYKGLEQYVIEILKGKQMNIPHSKRIVRQKANNIERHTSMYLSDISRLDVTILYEFEMPAIIAAPKMAKMIM